MLFTNDTLHYESASVRPPARSRLAGLALALGVLAVVLPAICIVMLNRSQQTTHNDWLLMPVLVLVSPVAFIVSVLAMRSTSRAAVRFSGRRQALVGLILSSLALLVYGGGTVMVLFIRFYVAE